jgi:ATP-binding cassette subfamily F protein uup
MREQLDEARSVAETISPGSDWIELAGKRIHVMSYLGDFLFSPRRAQSPVKTLSGGERNRLLLARLFARPANLLILDEPTNDLDLETLELLESSLQQYEGSVLLVSHDRAFMDAVATQTLVALGDGRWREYPGGYSDWIDQGGQWPIENRAGEDSSQQNRFTQPIAQEVPVVKQRRKLSFKEQRELEDIPERIDRLETEQARLQSAMSSADYYRQGAEQMRLHKSRLEEIDQALIALLERWEALQALGSK